MTRRLVPALLVLLLGSVGLVAAPAQAAATTGSVKGVVSLAGQPVKDLTVELYRTGDDGYFGSRLATDTTDSKGAYSFSFDTSDPEFFGHTVIVKDPAHRIVDTSRRFTDRPGRTVTRNVTAKRAATITGSLQRADGAASALRRVEVSGPFDSIDPDRDLPLSYAESVKVATNGSYALRGLPAGDYHLTFVDAGQTYFSQCYDSLPAGDCDESTTVTVAAGETKNLNPQVLTNKGRRLAGVVTDTSLRPVTTATVTATEVGGPGKGSDGVSSDGTFRVGPLTAGTYRLKASAGYPWAPYAGTTSYDLSSGNLSGLRIRLKSQPRIRATLTPGTGKVKVAVDVTRAASGSKPSGTVTVRWGTVKKTVTLAQGKGTATLSGLPKGKRQITISYAGTYSTADGSKIFYATVK